MAEAIFPLDVNVGDKLAIACQSLRPIGHGLGEIKSKLMKAVKAWLFRFDGDPGDEELHSPDHLQLIFTGGSPASKLYPAFRQCSAGALRKF